MSKSQLIAFYDDPSYDYQQYWEERKYEAKAEEIALRRLLKLIPQKGVLADIGAGFGRLTPLYAPLFKTCFLIDPSKRLLKQAKTLSKKCKNLVFKTAFAEKLPLKTNSLDTILFIRTFHHLRKPEGVIKEFFRVLKPNGFLILEFANKIHFKNCLKAIFRLDFGFFDQKPEDISRREKVVPFLNYHPQYVKNLLEKSGFRIIKTLSVSNLRHPLFKKLVPLPILLFFEAYLSSLVSHLPFFFGPSVFVLAQKTQK